MISSNELGSDKRHRLNKSDFAKIQKAIEKNVLNNLKNTKRFINFEYNQNSLYDIINSLKNIFFILYVRYKKCLMKIKKATLIKVAL